MCASYGLGGGPYSEHPLFGLDPMDAHEGRAIVDEWLREQKGKAAITGRNAVNLNPIIRADASGDRSIDLAWWWIWLDGSGPVKFSAFNSRDDRLLRSWRKPFQSRALLPAAWYVEKGVRFGLSSGEAFGIAAITSTVTDDATGEKLTTYSMVTRDAIGDAALVWHRMPLVLPREAHDEWLNPARQGDSSLLEAVRHASDDFSASLRGIGALPAASGGQSPTAPTLF